MRFFAIIFLCISLTSCFKVAYQCKEWKREGDFFATDESCTKCIDSLGPNKDAVRGCAMALDATTMMTGS